MSYQTYPYFLEGGLLLPGGYEPLSTIYAFANVEHPTEEVFGFIAESQDKIIIAFRGYGCNFERLTRVKAKYDPENIFRYPQSIPPVTECC